MKVPDNIAREYLKKWRSPIKFLVMRDAESKAIKQVAIFSFHLKYFLYPKAENNRHAIWHHFIWNMVCECARVPVFDESFFATHRTYKPRAAPEKRVPLRDLGQQNTQPPKAQQTKASAPPRPKKSKTAVSVFPQLPPKQPEVKVPDLPKKPRSMAPVPPKELTVDTRQRLYDPDELDLDREYGNMPMFLVAGLERWREKKDGEMRPLEESRIIFRSFIEKHPEWAEGIEERLQTKCWTLAKQVLVEAGGRNLESHNKEKTEKTDARWTALTNTFQYRQLMEREKSNGGGGSNNASNGSNGAMNGITGRAPATCYNYRQPGHKARNCPHREAGRGGGGGSSNGSNSKPKAIRTLINPMEYTTDPYVSLYKWWPCGPPGGGWRRWPSV